MRTDESVSESVIESVSRPRVDVSASVSYSVKLFCLCLFLGDTGMGWAGALNTIKPDYLKVYVIYFLSVLRIHFILIRIRGSTSGKSGSGSDSGPMKWIRIPIFSVKDLIPKGQNYFLFYVYYLRFLKRI